LKALLKWIKRALRRRIVTAWCPDCWEHFNPYKEHNCVVVEVQEIIYE